MDSRRNLVLALGLVAIPVLACGPFFPNTLLDQGDQAVLTAPEARFQKEIERMKLVMPIHQARPATNYAQQTFDAELVDLRAALEKAGVPGPQRDALLEGHRKEREKIAIFARTGDERADSAALNLGLQESYVLRPDPTNAARINGPLPKITPGLPGEFADYFRGSIAWHLGKMAEARSAWKALLARPPAERHFKSTWAAFMLGKSWEEEDSARAISFFQQVRGLAKAGFADTLGLAASSLGWEARLHLRKRDFAPALDLYLEHAASGDASALISLRWTASQALHAADSNLRALAAHPRAQRVITAYVISGGWRENPMDVDSPLREGMINALEKASAKAAVFPKPKPEWHQLKEPALRWLEAVEAARVKDVDSAEQLALAAYQGGQMERARRWLRLARPTPIAQWLQAKLLLRDGKVDDAAALISQLVRLFPVEPDSTHRPAMAGLAGSLFVKTSEFSSISVAEQLSGEWGVFRLARRQYAESLDALLRSGYWLDAAYVADRVLTLDELKSYVDRAWPAETSPVKKAEGAVEAEPREIEGGASLFGPLTTGERIRYLLARRLARAERRNEARAYFPKEWQALLGELDQALRLARSTESPAAERAKAFFAAARITRKQGLELLGTEVEPDWQVHAGNYQEGVTLAARLSLQVSNVLAATTSEIERASQHTVAPERRWHYRYQAAALAWEAARLMPDNSDETARVLCIGGTWIKYRDPQAADVFYKALVRRCRKTAMGAEADRIRWFPLLDAEGNLRPRAEQPLSPEERKARDRKKAEAAQRPPERE